MKPKSIQLGRTVSLPGYENFKFVLEVEIEESDNYKDVVFKAKEAVDDACLKLNAEYNGDFRALHEEKRSLEAEVKALGLRRDKLRKQVKGLEEFVEGAS